MARWLPAVFCKSPNSTEHDPAVRSVDRQPVGRVKGFLPTARKRKYDLRDVFDALLWITRTGCQWRNLDRQFSPWQVVHYHFIKWSRDHTLETVNDALNRRERELVLARQSTPSLFLVDAQSVRLLPRSGHQRGIDGGK